MDNSHVTNPTNNDYPIGYTVICNKTIVDDKEIIKCSYHEVWEKTSPDGKTKEHLKINGTWERTLDNTDKTPDGKIKIGQKVFQDWERTSTGSEIFLWEKYKSQAASELWPNIILRPGQYAQDLY